MVWGLLLIALLNNNYLLSEPPKPISEIACQELYDRFQDYFNGQIQHNPLCLPYSEEALKSFIYIPNGNEDIFSVVKHEYEKRGMIVDDLDIIIEASRLADRNRLGDETSLQLGKSLFLVNRADYQKLRRELLIQAVVKNMEKQDRLTIRYKKDLKLD